MSNIPAPPAMPLDIANQLVQRLIDRGVDELATWVSCLLQHPANTSQYRKATDDYLAQLCKSFAFDAAYLFTWDSEIEDHVLISQAVSDKSHRSSGLTISQVTDSLTLPAQDQNDKEQPHPHLGSWPLHIEDRKVGTIAICSQRFPCPSEWSQQQNTLSWVVAIYQHIIHSRGLVQAHRELEITKTRLESVLCLLEERNDTIESINAELRRSQTHSQRMATLGELITGVAHEINNPLTYVLSCLGLVQGGLESALEQLSHNSKHEPESTDLNSNKNKVEPLLSRSTLTEMREAAESASEGAIRIREIAKDLTALSRNPCGPAETIRLHDALTMAIRVAMPQIRGAAQLQFSSDEELFIRALRGPIAQVFINILVNAAQALAECYNSDSKGRIQVQSFGKSEQVCVVISDNGPGVPSSILNKILEPYFTTKPTGKGTGLGLSISNDIIMSFGGTLRLESKPGAGLKVFITFPQP